MPTCPIAIRADDAISTGKAAEEELGIRREGFRQYPIWKGGPRRRYRYRIGLARVQ